MSKNTPFFNNFIETQVEELSQADAESCSGGIGPVYPIDPIRPIRPIDVTMKAPSDDDEGGDLVTMKYPSDDDEGHDLAAY